MKTLAQCVKLRPVVVEASTTANKPLVNNAEPFNAFLLTNPRFGLTIDEVRADLLPEFAASGLEFDVSFLPSGDVVLRALSSGSWLQKLDSTLLGLKPAVGRKVSSLTIASSTSLCAVDASLNVLRKEDENAGSGGWSQVAKGGSGVKRTVDTSVGNKSLFTVLGTSAKAKKEKEKEKENEKKKVVVEDAVEDWEKEVEAWGDA
jgi:transcriptional repressor NF-X1